MLILGTDLPVAIDGPSQPWVFKDAWKSKPVAIEFDKPWAGLLLCLAVASRA
jgi:hypothetical protein